MEEEDNNKEEKKTAPLLLSLSRFAFPTSRRVVVVFDDTQKALSDMCVRWCFGTSARAGTSLSLSLSCSFLFSRKSLSRKSLSFSLSLLRTLLNFFLTLFLLPRQTKQRAHSSSALVPGTFFHTFGPPSESDALTI